MPTTAQAAVPEKVPIAGVPVARVSMDETLRLVESYIESGRPHLIATADASGIVAAQENKDLFQIYNEADLVTPDSVGVLWAAKRLGKPIAERVSGVDLVDAI